MKKMNQNINVKHEKALHKSHDQVGQLYPVLRDAEGKVIDGFHRLDIDHNWKSITLENVKTEEDRLIIHAHSNFMRRNISKKEKMDIVNRLGEIYYQQGLRPDVKVEYIKPNGKKQVVIVNQIKNKILKVLNGCLTSSQIRRYLLPKYKFQNMVEATKRSAKKRHINTSAWDLLLGSHEVDLKNRYGDDFFDRLKNEMLNKAKTLLRFDRHFINIVKAEIREEFENEIREKLKKEIRAELELEMTKKVENFNDKIIKNSQYEMLDRDFFDGPKVYSIPDSWKIINEEGDQS